MIIILCHRFASTTANAKMNLGIISGMRSFHRGVVFIQFGCNIVDVRQLMQLLVIKALMVDYDRMDRQLEEIENE